MFAEAAHTAINQRRKYTNQPYIVHPIAVAQLVKTAKHYDDNMLCAAYLHDVIEDTSIGVTTLGNYFSRPIVRLVQELTNCVPKSAGNRRQRFALELKRISQISHNAMTIKLCDLIDNTSTIVEHDPEFAKVYMWEKRELLQVLIGGDAGLWSQASKIVEDYFMSAHHV